MSIENFGKMIIVFFMVVIVSALLYFANVVRVANEQEAMVIQCVKSGYEVIVADCNLTPEQVASLIVNNK